MSPRDFTRRSTEPEWMDDETLDYATFRDCLSDLARVNSLTLAYRPTLRFLDRLEETGRLPRQRPLRVLDAGSGYGDMLRRIAAWADRKRVQVELIGIDLNRWSAAAAEEITPPHLPIHWHTGDIFSFPENRPLDVIISALFTHHLNDGVLRRFLRFMEDRARLGWFVNDLHRHPLPHLVFRAAAPALRLHPMVRHDGPISIERGFAGADWRLALSDAGISPADSEIAWWMPFRFCVSRMKPQ